jgi:hypothetical protein
MQPRNEKDRRSGLVTGDEFLDLVGVELSCPSGFRPVGARWSWRGGIGQLLEQRFRASTYAFVLL